MKTRLTQKQETFCIKYFELGNATEAAIIAGYNRKTAEVIASQNLRKLKIQERINELREEIKSAAIMSVEERMEKLSIIGRANLTDFQTVGADGSWIDIGPENPYTGALQEITSRTEYDDNSSNAAVITKIKLHDPVKAIDLLNKMDKIYSEGPTVNVDNRKIEIIVQSEKAKDLTERILADKRMLLET